LALDRISMKRRPQSWPGGPRLSDCPSAQRELRAFPYRWRWLWCSIWFGCGASWRCTCWLCPDGSWEKPCAGRQMPTGLTSSR